MTNFFRWIVRRSIRGLLLLPGHDHLRQLLNRLPTSRFAWLIPIALKGKEVVRWRDVRIAVNPGEMLGFYIYFTKEYSTVELDAIIDACEPGSCFADIGANIGMVSLAVARARPSVTVFAFEPDPVLAKWFDENLRLNPDLESRVQLFPYAIGNVDGESSFLPSNHRVNNGTGHLSTAHNLPFTFTVQVRRLDTLTATMEVQPPQIVKIDVEGSELDVIDGARQTLRDASSIFLETHAFAADLPDHTFNRLVLQRLNDLGFEIFLKASAFFEPLRDSHLLGPWAHIVGRKQ